MGTEILAKGMTSLPYSLAHPLQGFKTNAEKENWHSAMNYMLDLFETSCQFLSIVLLGLLKAESDELKNDPAIVKAIGKIDNKRPLSFGDWANDILTPLTMLAASRLPDNAFVQSISKVISHKKHIILGRKGEQSIVKIRNDYKGHGTTLSQDAVLTLEGRLREFTEALLPLAQMQFKAAVPGGGTLLLNGHSPEAAPADGTLQDGHYYFSCDGTLTDLYPLVYCNEKGHIYIFQTL